MSSEEEAPGADNNEPVPPGIHATMTVIAFLIFILSMQQLCSASMDSVTIKYRAGVACSCFTFLIVSIALNFELAKDAELINIADNFVLIVRTLMVLWNFIAFVLAYWFLIHAVRAAYKSTHGINKVEAPGWIQKFWFVVICVEEIVLFLCYVFAFATMDTLAWKLLLLSNFVIAVVGASIVMGALIDVQLSIRSAVYTTERNMAVAANGQVTTLTNDSIQIKRLKYGQRILSIITVFAFGIIVAAVVNIWLIVANLIDTNFGGGPLKSRVLDNTYEYMTYVVLLDLFNLSLLFWTYKGHEINYCCFCCSYKKYATHEFRNDEIDTTVLCFLCCGGLIEQADDKRRKILDDLPEPSTPKASDVEAGNSGGNGRNENANKNAKNAKNANNYNDANGKIEKRDTQTNLKTFVSGNRPSDTAGIKNVRRVAQADTMIDDIDFNNPIARQKSAVDAKVRVVIFEFDGVLTGEPRRVFEHRTIEQIQSMPYSSVSFNFGGPERVIGLRDHFKTLFDRGVKMYIVSKEATGKLFTILKKLEIVQFFMKVQQSSRLLLDSNDAENVSKDVSFFEKSLLDEDANRALMYGIVGCDNPVMLKNNGSLKSFILELVKLRSKQTLLFDEIMFVSSNANLVQHFKQINLCRAFQIESVGLNDHDFHQIESRV